MGAAQKTPHAGKPKKKGKSSSEDLVRGKGQCLFRESVRKLRRHGKNVSLKGLRPRGVVMLSSRLQKERDKKTSTFREEPGPGGIFPTWILTFPHPLWD